MSFVVMVNGSLSSFFKASRGFRQDDPLPPLLFIVVIKELNKIMLRLREIDLFKGLKVGVGEHMQEVTHLFFVDDTLGFHEPDEGALLNLRCILLRFQAVLGLNINFSKSALVRLGDGNDATKLVRVLSCKIVELPIKYLGLSLGSIINM